MIILTKSLSSSIWEDIEKPWDDPSKEERECFGREPGQGKRTYEGMELDIKVHGAYVHQLWGRNCHLQSVVENRDMVFTYDGKKMMCKFM